ncbi:MAG TPA: hypothetical protein VGJ57_01185 [Nitrospirales bacterium]|jgi:hypothetical protein
MEGASQRIGRLLIDIAFNKEWTRARQASFLTFANASCRAVSLAFGAPTEVETRVASDEIEGSEALR